MIKLCIIVEYLNIRIWQLNNNLLSSGILYEPMARAVLTTQHGATCSAQLCHVLSPQY